MRKLFIIALMACMSVGAFAQQSLVQRARMAKSEGGEKLEQFKKELSSMQNSKDEETLIDCANAYYTIGEESVGETMIEGIKKKFPKGRLMRSEQLDVIYKAKPAAEAEKAYNKWIKTYPASRLGDDIAYDYAAYSVAASYMEEGNEAKAMDYLHKLTNKQWMSTPYYSIATMAMRQNKNDFAEKVLAEAVAKLEEADNERDPRAMSQIEEVYAVYADVLYKKGDIDGASKLFEKVSPRRRSINYGKILLSKGQAMQAFTMADNQYRNGNFSENVENLMKEAWQKANGNLNGFDDHIKGIKARRLADQKKEIAGKMTSKPAPDFAIKDIDGNIVRLSDLKGKIVVIDFWATWCGPCKASLPAMQKTVRKYKDDKDVEFLFIHTWERGTVEAAYADAKAYLKDNGFADDFHLLMDTKNPETKKNDAISAYGVKGIPAKFIIDKNGNIRFNVSGFAGNDEEAVAELSTMIEMARNAK